MSQGHDRGPRHTGLLCFSLVSALEGQRNILGTVIIMGYCVPLKVHVFKS